MSIKGLLQRVLLCITALVFYLPCFGQSSADYQLKQSTVSSGGGAIQSANLVLKESVIGGFAAGMSASGNFRLNGGVIITSVKDMDMSLLPTSFLLLQNYPNPFNPETTIAYTLPEGSEVKINIFNALGQLVRTFEQGLQEAGQYRLQWDGKNHAGAQVGSGVYYYQMVAQGFRDVRQMLLLR